MGAVKLIQNDLVLDDRGQLKAVATEREEVIPAGLVFRSVGYRGQPLPDVPFNESWGTILNEGGRAVDAAGDQVVGLYTAGWIKRGPSGVIGTNKTCAQETVGLMMQDLQVNRMFEPSAPSAEAALKLIQSRQPDFVSFADWKKIDEAEVAKGVASDRPRVKFTRVADMLEVARA